jgi:1-phosphatidylinositol phosphodiesterase
VYFQLGTLGEARGMLTLLQRFDYTLLPPQDGKSIGIHLSGSQWIDNYYPSFQLKYNTALNQSAFIEVRLFDLVSFYPCVVFTVPH